MKFPAVVLFVLLVVLISVWSLFQTREDTIKIGLLYSQTGTMAAEEKAIAEALKFQVENTNRNGGVLGRYIEIVEADGASNDQGFANAAETLIDQDITTIFGCWTSASRKAVKPIIEQHNGLLFYPVQYEGVESSENIIYLGTTPNQQINPVISFIKEQYGAKIMVIGSNYIYPRITGIYLEEMANFAGFEILEQHYVPLGERNFDSIMKRIQQLQPTAIINTLNGDSNRYFFEALNQFNRGPQKTPVFSTSIDERSVQAMMQYLPEEALNNHYLSGSYFFGLKNLKNQTLALQYQERYGTDFKLTDAGFNTHIAFEYWLRAVNTMETTSPDRLIVAMAGDSLQSASGVIYLDRRNLHLHKTIRLVRIENGLMKPVWTSKVLASPTPYPSFKSIEFWQNKQQTFYQQWQNRWQSNEAVILKNRERTHP